ncbi:TPR-like protein [Dioscorea alata]|uniref:TPR-like protein n=1 Tax=Dioscorea alata TaxID=55571 RepID=A0ACB7VHJ7_DIOAL|nr:TPR-like protein [Dioscorea alata]
MRSKAQLSNLLLSCSDAKTLTNLHSLLLRIGLLPSNSFFATNLVSSYSNLHSLYSARKVFDETPHPNTRLWNAILRAHSRAHQWRNVLFLFRRMNHQADCFTLHIVLKACTAVPDLNLGRVIHCLAVKNPTAHSDMFVGAGLVEMYGKCGDMGGARKVFDEFSEPDVVLWTSVVSGYQQNGLAEDAVLFFSDMVVGHGVTPDPVTLVSIASAIGQLGDLRAGKSCHAYVLKRNLLSKLSLCNSILNFYANSGTVEWTQRVFDYMPDKDVVTWSCMISCHVRSGNAGHALDIYRMMVGNGLEPNSITMVSVLQACALAVDLEEGRRMHELAIQKGFELDLGVSTALMDMYMKCSCYNEAFNLFHRMPKKDSVSWSVMIGGCAQNGLANESLRLFRCMLEDHTSPDAVTIVKVLSACSQLSNLHQAICLHSYIIFSGFDNKLFVNAALIDLYSKCGSLIDAVKVFNSVTDKDVAVWCSMITAYGIHGHGIDAITLFKQMVDSSIKPNNVTFVSVLTACSHAGLIEEGNKIFYSMQNEYGLLPDSEHCNIMVDMFARTGKLQEALKVIEGMPAAGVSPHAWCALLAGCRIHQDIKMGKFVARKLLELEPEHAGYYNLMSNMYAFDGNWDNVIEIKSVIKERRLKKTSGYSSIQMGNGIQTSF